MTSKWEVANSKLAFVIHDHEQLDFGMLKDLKKVRKKFDR